MDEDKHDQIIEALEKKALDVEFGVLIIELKVHRGRISAGEIIERREKLG